MAFALISDFIIKSQSSIQPMERRRESTREKDGQSTDYYRVALKTTGSPNPPNADSEWRLLLVMETIIIIPRE
jgi:hypothetical protein